METIDTTTTPETVSTAVPFEQRVSTGMEIAEQLYEGRLGQSLDLSFVYEGVSPRDIPANEAMSRIRAASIASSISRSEKDGAAVFKDEFAKLRGMKPQQQMEYVNRRIKEEVEHKLYKDIERNIIQAEHELTVLNRLPSEVPVPGTAGTPAAATMTIGQDLQARAEFYRQRAAKNLQTGIAIAGAGGKLAYTDEGGKTKRTLNDLQAREFVVNKNMMETLEALGYDVDDINPFKAGTLWQGLRSSGWWAKQLFSGRMLWETWKYDTGPFDMKNLKQMDFDKFQTTTEGIKAKLIKDKADPVTIMGTFGSLDPLASEGWKAFWLTADSIPLLGYVRYGPKAVRAVQKARIIRSMTSSGVANSLGSSDIAGRLSARALISRDVAGTGIDPITAGANASPFPYARLDAASTDGISWYTQRHIERERMLQNHYINQALNNADTLGPIRPGELEAFETAAISKLPLGAEVIERTPYNMRVRVTIPAKGKFTTPEELASAQNRYDIWRETHIKAKNDLELFEDQIKNANWEPDPGEVARLERAVQKSKEEMDAAHKLLVKGTPKDEVTETTVWYSRDQYTGHITGVLDGNPLWNKVLSAEGYLEPIENLAVKERTLILAQQEKLQVHLQKVMRSAAADLNKKQLQNVEAVLSHGRDISKKFTAQELMQGLDVPGVGTLRLNKKEIASYFKFRDTMDAFFGMRSVMRYKELGWKGFGKQTFIKIVRASDDDVNVEVVEPRKVFIKGVKIKTDEDGAVRIDRPPDVSKILDVTGRGAEAKVISISGDVEWATVQNRIAKGDAMLVQVESPIRVGKKHAYNYMLVKTNRIRELTPDVLGYREGYVPTIYRAPWAVRMINEVTFDGTTKLETKNVARFFDTEEEANAWKAAQTDSSKYVVNSDKAWRSHDPYYSAEVNDAVFTGLFEDYRGVQIPYGSQGGKTPVDSAFNAMDRYLDNLAWSYPLNDWRQGMLARYFNSVNEYLKTPNSLDSELVDGIKPNQMAAIEALRNWLVDQLHVTSAKERSLANYLLHAGDRMETSLFWKAWRKVPLVGEKSYQAARMKMLYGADKANAYGVLRATASNVYLGGFNVSQLFVQASNITNVFSQNPLNAHHVLRRIFALRAAAFLSPVDPNYDSVIKILSKTAGLGMKTTDFDQLVRAFHKSGWAYTTRSSADMRRASRMISPGGALRQDLRAIQKLSMLPLSEGELWSRLYGWVDAYTRIERRYRKAGKAVDLTSMDKVFEILSEATRVSFNYTAANAARWQKGAWSIPTQFLQVPAKFYQELLMPIVTLGKYKGNFTTSQKFAMLMGQAILYGSAGVPLGSFLKDQLTEYLKDPDSNGVALFPTVDDRTLSFLAGGVIDMWFKDVIDLAYEFLDGPAQNIHPALSRRMSLASGFDLLFSNFSSENRELGQDLYMGVGKSMLGAAGGVLVQQAMPAIGLVLKAHDTKSGYDSIDQNNLPAHLGRLATIFKSADNVQRARLWAAAEAILSKNKNKPMLPIDPDGEDHALIWLKMLGIGTYEEFAAIRLADWNAKNNPQKDVARAVEQANQLMLEYLRDDKLITPDELENFSAELGLIAQSLKSDEDRELFGKEWSKNLWEERTEASKIYKTTLGRVIEYNKEDLKKFPAEAQIIEQRLRAQAEKQE